MPETNLLNQNQISPYQLAKLGQMTMGILHDVNSTLTALNLNLQLVDTKVIETNPQLQNSLQCVQQLIALMSSARRQLSGNSQRENICLNPCLEKVLKLLNYKAQLSNITIRSNLEEIDIFADSARVEQLLLNLILNAIDAIERDNKPNRVIMIKGHISYRFAERSQTQKQYSLSVQDNGTGIKPEHLQKIFQPYFTTKSKNTSIGIGMQIIKQIVETELKGRISVSSLWGLGTEMTVSFPLAERLGNV